MMKVKRIAASRLSCILYTLRIHIVCEIYTLSCNKNYRHNQSAPTNILSHIKNVIGKSMKTDSRIFTDKEIDSMFEFKELYTIRRFAEIAGVKFNESKFTNRKEFQEYFQKWLEEKK